MSLWTTRVRRSASATASAYLPATNAASSAFGAMSSVSCSTVLAWPKTSTRVMAAPGASVFWASAKAQGVFETLTSSAAASVS